MYVPSSPAGVLLCHGCRGLNRCQTGLEWIKLRPDGIVVSKLSCPSDAEGGPNVAHGAWTATVMDELVGNAMMLREKFAVTGTLEVDFHRPVPIGLTLMGTAQIDKDEGRKTFVSARIELASSGALLASASAIMIKPPTDHAECNDQWVESRAQK